VPLCDLAATCPWRPPDWRYRAGLITLDCGRRLAASELGVDVLVELLTDLRQQHTSGPPTSPALVPYGEAIGDTAVGAGGNLTAAAECWSFRGRSSTGVQLPSSEH
jgi:hypothetical protein